jgi:IS30 family transposase
LVVGNTSLSMPKAIAVISIVERYSKKTILKKVSTRTAHTVSTSIIESLKLPGNLVLSITADNGCEFAYHEKISKELNIDFYCAHPYSSWERGLNENTNGLVRQYLKKGSRFTEVTDSDLEIIMSALINRPRKSLGFSTPNEVFEYKI